MSQPDDMSPDDDDSVSASLRNLNISTGEPQDIEERLSKKIGEIDEEKRLVFDGEVLLARFSQFQTLTDIRIRIDVHDNLRDHLFTPEAMVNMLELINSPYCAFYGPMADPSQTPQKQDKNRYVMEITRSAPLSTQQAALETVNIRFASFYVKITSDPEMPIQIYLINTLPVGGSYVIDIIKLRDEGEADITSYTTGTKGVMFNLGLKIIRELQVIGYKLDGRDAVGSLLISFDVYYNRTRDPDPQRDTSGKFHRDISGGPGNDTNYASLEYFVPEDIVMLGPEAFYKPIEGEPVEVYMDRYPDAELKEMYETRKRVGDLAANSFRVLAKDGTTILFNNKEFIHATPITRPIQVYPLKRNFVGNPVNMNVFGTNTERLEVSRPFNPVVRNTATGARSFVRCWIASGNPFSEEIEKRTLINYDIGTIRACISSMRTFQPTSIDDTDIFGGTVTINNENNIVHKMIEPHMVDTNSNVKTNLLLKSEMQSKNNIINESTNKLIDFKIVGNPSNPPIELNLDVPFEDITGKSNINNYKLKEMAFIKAIVNKKGGKNRKYKKRYINKTKKARKTKKVRKQYKNVKTKKVKRVKNVKKYSKKNYKY